MIKSTVWHGRGPEADPVRPPKLLAFGLGGNGSHWSTLSTTDKVRVRFNRIGSHWLMCWEHTGGEEAGARARAERLVRGNCDNPGKR